MREIIVILSILGSAFVLSSPAGKVLHAKSGTEKPAGSVNRRFVRSVDLKAAKSSTDDSRLPRNVIPTGYKLQLQPFPEEGYFKGRVWINLTCQETTTSITLHAYEDIRIAHSEVRVKEISDVASQDSTINNATKSASMLYVVASTKKDPVKEWYVITLADSLKKGGMFQLDIPFSGDLATGFTQGFFRASYQLHRTREERWFAATKMSPSNARHVFPCFDEPDLKAPFEISLAREEKMLALSNMPVQSRSAIENGGSWSWVHFQRTPPMSTFSVAVVVSDLEHLVANSTGSVTISVFARPTFLSQVQGVLEKAPRMLSFLERYLGVPFPLPKLDLVALPHYSDPDPADHWGLIILKESDFVNDDALAWRLADEMVQQWFGHLATPGWWTDASINKALANYMATLVSTEGKINWNLLTGYSLYYEYSKRHPQTTQEEFLTITRIQWLLRMLNYTLTENTFRDGLRTFLQEKKLKTYNQSDLWKALTEQAHVDQTLAADINVEDIATSWISRERFPVVTVTRDYEDNSASVEQHMFLRERPNEHNDRDTLLWWVPLLYLSADNIDLNEQRPPVTWMHEEKHATLTDLPGSESFLIINPEEIAMFMVNYDSHNWALLAEYLHGQGPSIPGVTRAKLLHDAWNLALGGELDVATALNLTIFLEDPKRETELPVWHAFFTMVDHLGHQVSGTPSGLKLEEYARIILTRLLDSLGSPQPDEDSDRTKLRLLVHDLLCPLGHTTCVQEAQQSFAKWMASEDPDAGNPVADLQLCTVFKWGTVEEWEFGMQRVIHFPAQRKQSERSYLLKTLAGCPRQPEKVERILNMTLLDDNGNWTDADVRLVLSMVTGSATGYNTLFNFLVQNWDEIKQKYDGKPHMWEYLIHRATEMFKTQEGLHMVSELYVKRQGEFGSAESVVEQSLRIINAEAQWSDQNLSSMEAWLDARLSSLN